MQEILNECKLDELKEVNCEIEGENWINNSLRPMFKFKSSLEMVKLTS